MNEIHLPKCLTDELERSEMQDAIDNALIADEHNTGFTDDSMPTDMLSLQSLINDYGDNTVATYIVIPMLHCTLILLLLLVLTVF